MKIAVTALALLSVLATACAAGTEGEGGSTGSAIGWHPSVNHHLRVKVIVLDPAIHAADGSLVRMSVAHPGWQNDFRAFPGSVAASLGSSSHGTVSFDIVGAPVVVTNHLPVFEDGYRYTPDQLEAIVNADNAHRYTLRHQCTGTIDDPHCADQVDYAALSNELGLASGIARGEFDEVWVFAPPFSGFYESRMLGSSSYPCNSPPERRISGSNFVVMGFNFERDLGSALHSYGHRAEFIMDHVYGLFSLWAKFTGRDGVGTVHTPVNGTQDYDYANTRSVASNVDAWASVPMLSVNDVATRNISCASWGCTEAGYMNWWFGHMPYGQPNAPDWWANVAMLEDRVDTSLPHRCASRTNALSCALDSACTWYPCANACALDVGEAPGCAQGSTGSRSTTPEGGTCGDHVCDRGDDAGEDCETCPADCGECATGGGDGSGTTMTESCGNGTCGSGESCSNCAADCGTCDAGATCPAGTYSIWTCDATRSARVRCIDGVVSTETCAYGCIVHPVGTDDQCASDGAACPAGTYAIWTCNAAGTARTRCLDGAVTTETCSNGCRVNPVGTDDVCNP